MASVTQCLKQDYTLSAIRSGFVMQGTSLHRWCRENGEDTSNVRRAIAGTWKGPKATAVLKKVATAAGVKA